MVADPPDGRVDPEFGLGRVSGRDRRPGGLDRRLDLSDPGGVFLERGVRFDALEDERLDVPGPNRPARFDGRGGRLPVALDRKSVV